MRVMLGELLINQGGLTRPMLNEVLRYQRSQGGRLGEILIQLGLVQESQISRALSLQKELLGSQVASDSSTRPRAGRLSAREETDLYPIIPRSELLPDDISNVCLSPDGTRMSFLAPLEDIRTVWVAPVDDVSAARPLPVGPSFRPYHQEWAYTNRHVFVVGDKEGDERPEVLSIDVETRRHVHLEPPRVIRWARKFLNKDATYSSSYILHTSPKFPKEILIAVDFGITFHPDGPLRPEVYRVHIVNGKARLVRDGFGEHVKEGHHCFRFLADDDFNLKIAVRHGSDGCVVFARKLHQSWSPLLRFSGIHQRISKPICLDRCGKRLFMLDSRDHGHAAAKVMDLRTRVIRTLAEPRRADIETLLLDPQGTRVEGVVEYQPRIHVRALKRDFACEIAALKSSSSGIPLVVSRSMDDRCWIICDLLDTRPPRYYVYDRKARAVGTAVITRESLASYCCARMYPITIPARDGLRLPGYLSLPPWIRYDMRYEVPRPRQPLPMVLLVHGGPAARDYWGFDVEHQWLANRGYAVLSVNYRGSTGFGYRLRAVSWFAAPEVFEDLVDGVEWATREGIADGCRIGIMGASFGGYMTLLGLATAPELFACGVDIFGISNLRTDVGDQWAREAFGVNKTIGAEILRERSPYYLASLVRKPLLIAHGANDPRVRSMESDQMVRELLGKRKRVTYLSYPNEGHGFERKSNRLSFYAIVEAFLSQHLGGRFEGFGGDLNRSSVRIRHGAEFVSGLDSFWKALKRIEVAADSRSANLNLANLGLSSLPPAVGSLVQLETLDVSRNRLVELPPEVCRLKNLKVLRLSHNQILRLPAELSWLRSMEELDLRNNQISQLPRGVDSLKNLHRLRLEGNPIGCRNDVKPSVARPRVTV